jgi:hypothetical protein
MRKIRTMRADTPSGHATGAQLTTADDDRITRVGGRLRSYHIDELAQLVNVAKGDMLLLGPRPEAPEYVDMDNPDWQHVLSVPPGMAGPTQVIVNDWERHIITTSPDGSGYEDIVLPVKLAIDRWYLRTCSPLTDVLVAITLVRRFVPGTGSWTLKQRVLRAVPQAHVAIGKKRRRKDRESAVPASDGNGRPGPEPLRAALAPTWRRPSAMVERARASQTDRCRS